jgi:hypothetical protein
VIDLEGGTRVLRRPFGLHDRDHRQLLAGQAIGLHVAQHGNREQSRRPHRPIGLLELAGEAGGRHDIAGAPDPGAAAFAMRDQHRLTQARGDRRGGVADVDHQRAAADRSAVDPFRGQAQIQIVCHGHRGLAGGRDAVDVGELEAGIGHRVECRVGVQLDLRDVGDDAEPRGLGSTDDGDAIRAIVSPYVASGSTQPVV